MADPKIMVDDLPPCLACGAEVTSARYRSVERDFILWSRSSTAVLLRPCGHVLAGDTAGIWASAALRRAA